MSDILLEIGQKSPLGKMISKLGVPVPPRLKRFKEQWPLLALQDQEIIVGGGGDIHQYIAETIIEAGGNVNIVGEKILPFYVKLGDAYARPVHRIYEEVPTFRPHALVFNAMEFKTTDDLRQLYDFFHSRLRSVAASGRMILIARNPADCKDVEEAASARAVEGFMRSLAKEIGNKGATANIIYMSDGLGAEIKSVLHFLLSPASAYIDAQPFYVSQKQVKGDDESFSFRRALEGKVALVSGAAQGIGKATARVLAREGAKVICLDIPGQEEALSFTAKEVGGVVLLQDVYEEDAAEKIAKFIKKEFGSIDVVAHIAGITRDRTLGKMSKEYWDSSIGINLSAVIKINKKLLGGLLNKGGRIICTSSIAGIAGNFGQTNYAASKAGLIGYIKALAADLAKKQITINAVAPGFIETSMTARIPVMTREVARKFCNLGQAGHPEDVGQTILFFAQPASGGINGETIRVCGANLLGA